MFFFFQSGNFSMKVGKIFMTKFMIFEMRKTNIRSNNRFLNLFRLFFWTNRNFFFLSDNHNYLGILFHHHRNIKQEVKDNINFFGERERKKNLIKQLSVCIFYKAF
jgi:hypothetical protein